MTYNPQFLSWCKSYEEEVKEFKELIDGKPNDIKLLKQEYLELTGKRYKKEAIQCGTCHSTNTFNCGPRCL